MNPSSRPSFSSSHLPSPAQTAEVLELLRSDDLPGEFHSFQSTIASCLADVAFYDLEIERLVSERDELKQYCDQCCGVFAPVKRLPAEILIDIFALCASTPRLHCDWTHRVPKEVSDPIGPPHLINLLLVCSSWYNTVMATPSLWASIQVDLCSITDQGLAHLSRSLVLSRNHPLTIHVFSSDLEENGYRGLELLCRSAERWRMVDIYIDLDEENLRVFSSHVPGNLLRLERLGIAGNCADLDIFEAAPQLTHAVLSDGIRPEPLPKLPWNQLRELTYYTSDPTPVFADVIAHRLETMSRCSSECAFNLYDLNVSHIYRSWTSFTIQSEIQSHIPILRLAILDKDGEYRPALGAILGALTLPCLQELHFRSFIPAEYPLFWPQTDFMAFASRSSLRDTLTKLLLYDMVITEDALVKCLAELKVLRELFIQDVVVSFSECCLITDSLLRRLFWRDDSSCLVPHLHCFSFYPLFQFGANTAKFVDSRLGKASNGPFTIQAFYAEDNFFDDSTLAYMTALHAEGRLRWSLQDREILRQKLADIHLF